MSTEKPGIYSIRHGESGRVYVGSASNISKRWSRHRAELRNGTHRNIHLQAAWAKYGEAAFEFAIVELTDDLTAREQHWMDTLKAYAEGFNLCPVARSSRGREITEVERQKLSESQKRRWQKWRDEHGKQKSQGKSRGTPSPNYIEEFRQRTIARNRLGAKLTEAQKQEARERYGPLTPNGKGRKNVKNGGISMKMLADEYGVSLESMWRALRGGEANERNEIRA